MFIEKLHFYIALFAGAVMTAVNIYLQADLLDVCVRLIMTLILFYVIGYFTQRYIRKRILKPPDPAIYDEPEAPDVAIEKAPAFMDDDPFPDDDSPADDDLTRENDDLPHEDDTVPYENDPQV